MDKPTTPGRFRRFCQFSSLSGGNTAVRNGTRSSVQIHAKYCPSFHGSICLHSLSSATSCPRGWLYARYASRFEQRIGMLIKGDHSEKYATVRQSKHLCVGSSLPCQTCAAFPSVFNAVSWLVRLQRRVLASPGANWERRRCKEHLLKIYCSFAGAISKTTQVSSVRSVGFNRLVGWSRSISTVGSVSSQNSI